MKLKFDYAFMTKDTVGEGGVDVKDLEKDADEILNAFNSVLNGRGKGSMAWTELPSAAEEEIDKIIDYTRMIRKKADSFVVLGIGGSALGCLSVSHALLHIHHNQLSRKKRENTPKLYIEDNIDPEKIAALFDVIDVKKSYFNFITKSGETSEPLSQFLIIYDKLKRILGKKKARQRIIVTTTIGKGSLYDVAVKEGFKIFDVPQGVGGRFSVLCPVGLVPMAAVGINIKMLLKGASEMDEACFKSDIKQNPALMTAYLQYKSLKSGKNISVIMPYAESLKYMADFYAQLWGESLGKETDKNGKTVNTGQTPVKALGATDQHSQVQLYTQGPADKVVTFIAVEEFRDNIFIPQDCEIGDFAFLKGKNLADALNAAQKATAYALVKAGRPSFTITLPCICEYTIGELLSYFMYQTAFMGELLNVDTYNQPGVEEGKKGSYAMLGRAAYASKLEEMKKVFVKDYQIIDGDN